MLLNDAVVSKMVKIIVAFLLRRYELNAIEIRIAFYFYRIILMNVFLKSEL